MRKLFVFVSAAYLMLFVFFPELFSEFLFDFQIAMIVYTYLLIDSIYQFFKRKMLLKFNFIKIFLGSLSFLVWIYAAYAETNSDISNEISIIKGLITGYFGFILLLTILQSVFKLPLRHVQKHTN